MKWVVLHQNRLRIGEKNYQNLEHECMAAIWGMTDQKPLVAIFKKHLCDVSPSDTENYYL